MSTLVSRLANRAKERLGERGFAMLGSLILIGLCILAFQGGNLLLSIGAHPYAGYHNYPLLFIVLLIQGCSCILGFISAIIFWESLTDSNNRDGQERQD